MHGFSLGTACCHGEQDAYDGYSRQGTLDEMAKRVSKTFVGGDASIHKICFLGFTLVAKIGIPLLFSKQIDHFPLFLKLLYFLRFVEKTCL
jgi:hypothetical protein